MIHVTFVEPNTPNWNAWKTEAQAATIKLIAKATAGEAFSISDALYKKMRQVIFDAFHGKCAYCEAKFVLDQSGDVEHFRPKGGVSDARGQPVVIADATGSQKKHPGYYWLAYDWHNLLPSCAKCSRLAKTRNSMGTVGKGTRFPIAGVRAAAPGEESNEQPLFIHPMFEDPEQHLILDSQTGIIGYRTPRGQACVELLDLNREGLPEERRKIYDLLRAALVEAQSAFRLSAMREFQKKTELMTRYKQGVEPYSWPGRKAIADSETELRAFLVAIG